jgi:hypothetical protein
VTEKPSKSTDNRNKIVDTKSSESSIEQSSAAFKIKKEKVLSKKEEESELAQVSLTTGKRDSIDSTSSGSTSVKPRKKKQVPKSKAEPTDTFDLSKKLINYAASCATPKLTASASAMVLTIFFIEILFSIV